ncbi:hypothetical protein T492DRAFT_1043062, partial [Pavlovales sp. CCMP2436]
MFKLPPRPLGRGGELQGAYLGQGTDQAWPAVHDSAELRPPRRLADRSELAKTAAVQIQTAFRAWRQEEKEMALGSKPAPGALELGALSEGFDSPPFELQKKFARRRPIDGPLEASATSLDLSQHPFEEPRPFSESPRAELDEPAWRSQSPARDRARAYGLSPEQATRQPSPIAVAQEAFGTPPSASREDLRSPRTAGAHPPVRTSQSPSPRRGELAAPSPTRESGAGLSRPNRYPGSEDRYPGSEELVPPLSASPRRAPGRRSSAALGSVAQLSLDSPPLALAAPIRVPVAVTREPPPRRLPPSVPADTGSRQSGQTVRAAPAGAHASTEKLASILSFLEQAESVRPVGSVGLASTRTSCAEAALPSIRAAPVFPSEQFLNPSTPTDPSSLPGPASDGGASGLYSGVKAKMAALKQQLADESSKAVQLQLELDDCARRELATHAAAANSSESLKSEHETAMARHLDFIDRLLADKAELASQVHACQSQAGVLEAKFEQRLRAKDEALTREVKRRADSIAALEKAKREQWMAAKAKEIKELTIRGRTVSDERAACARELKGAGARADEAVENAVSKERQAAAESIERARNEADMAARAARKGMLTELDEVREMSENARRRETARHEAELREVRAAADALISDARASASAGRQGELAAAAAARRDAEVSTVIARLSEEVARTKRELNADAQRQITIALDGKQREADEATHDAVNARARAEQVERLYAQLRDQLDRTTAAAADSASEREHLRLERTER